MVNITEEINLIEKLFASEINYFYNNYSRKKMKSIRVQQVCLSIEF